MSITWCPKQSGKQAASSARAAMTGVMVSFLLTAGLGIAAAQWRFQTTVVEKLAAGEVDWTTGVVRSRARSSATEQTGASPSQHAAAYAQAVQAAQRHLLAALLQVRLDAERTVGNVLQEAADKRQQLAALVAEADVVQTRYLPRQGVEVTLQMALSGRVTSLVWPATAAAAGTSGETADAGYTGVIIDARGLAIRQALLPEVRDEAGETVYAPARVSTTAAVQRGYVVYTNALDHPQVAPRVGEHPLIIQARGVAGEERVNVLIRRSDAEIIHQSPTIRRLLERCQILIVG